MGDNYKYPNFPYQSRPGPKPEPEPGMDAADTGELRDPDFETWYRVRGYRLFGTNKRTAQQYYDQRKGQQAPPVADASGVLQDLMAKAMRV